MKIAVFSADPGNHRFIQPIINKWVDAGHPVTLGTNFQPQEADVYWFDFVDNNLIVASKEFAADLKTKKVIARLHAVEYYVGHYLAVDWTAVDTLIFVSDRIRRKIGNLPTKTITIENGIDLERLTFKERHSGFQIGYAGNIVPTKGILLMFHYFKQLLNKNDRYRLKMVGLNRFHGREGEYFSHYLKTAGLIPYIQESAEVDDINAWLEGIDYLWQPSLAESFSIIVGEAMAKGIKPLINDFEGASEIWPEKLIYRDFDSFQKLIEGEYTSQNYRAFVERYDLNKQMEKINLIV